MTNSRDTAADTARDSPRDSALRARFEQLSALRSAWGVLAPSGLSAEKEGIGERGRALDRDLVELFGKGPRRGDPAAIQEIDARLDALECEMRAVALKIPVAQLRSTLPERVAIDRRGVLDLLDLILGAEVAGLDGTEERISTIDYVITLLCTGGVRGAALQDPVTLTPRLYSLCEQSEVEYDPRLPALEAEFFAAADMHEADAREQTELRTLRLRKMELGSVFFAPRVLRSIVTYNAALLQRIDEDFLDSLNWGSLPSTEEADTNVSVFESPAIRELAVAVRRRASGDPPGLNAIDRIVWCLDLAYLSKPEYAAVRCESVGLREDLEGTTILVGLLCRSAVVLDEEFPAIGVSSELVSGAWVRELDEALQQEINQRVSGGDYDGACVLSELKSKFLSPELAEVHRRNRAPRPAGRAAATADRVEEEAKQIVREALEAEPTKAGRGGWRDWPWGYLARAGTAVLGVLAALVLARVLLWDAGRLGSEELDRLSPFLSSGMRNGEGRGPSFVGEIDEDWLELTVPDQMRTATLLVKELRGQGVREIMIYDDDGRLRIQALGEQPPRVVPASDG